MSLSLFDDLKSASLALGNVLEKYIDTCTKLRGHSSSFWEHTSRIHDQLLDHVANELELIASYEVKLKQAESTMKAVRNSFPSIVPISSLPPEILIRVFHIVLDDQPEPLDETNGCFLVSLRFPKHPETLTHVCSQWRQVAITSPALWTRIDLVLHHSLASGFLARAKVHVERASELPLDVHMSNPARRRRIPRPQGEFGDFDFLAFAKTPIRSLKLVSYYGFYNEHYDFVCYCILSCAQQKIKQLTIRNAGDAGGPPYFIESIDDPHYSSSLHVDLPKQSLEGIWRSTSVLRLAGLYPYWTSQAYHQLVDLRLGSDRLGRRVPVTEAQIVDILKASPGLRVFHLRLNLTDPLPEDAPVEAIQLEQLESINMSSTEVNPSQILRHIYPGQKPLQLSIHDEPTVIVEQFLRRSNVTELRMVSWETYPPVNAICLCPNLRVLVLDGWGGVWDTGFQTTPEQGGEEALGMAVPIQRLYILRCGGMTLAELQQIVDRHSVRELTLWRTRPKVDIESRSGSRDANVSEVSTLCPIVGYLRDSDRNPIDHWDLF